MSFVWMVLVALVAALLPPQIVLIVCIVLQVWRQGGRGGHELR